MADTATLNGDTVEKITGEIARIGGDVKALDGEVRKELKQVRDLAEAKNSDYGTVQRSMEAFERKLEALINESTSLKTRHTEIETALARNATNVIAGGDPTKAAELERDAIEFKTLALARAGRIDPGQEIDRAAVNLDEFKSYRDAFHWSLRRDDRKMPDTAQKALSVGSDRDGGYMVPPAMDRNVRRKLYETSPIRELASVITIGTDALEIPIDDGEFGYGWVGETESRPETTTSQLGTQRITVHEMYAMPAATQQLLDDSTVNVEGWIMDKLADAFSRGEALAFMSGNGIKKPRGLLDYPETAPVAGSVRGWIETFKTGHATLVTADSIMQLGWNLKERYQANATWLWKRKSLGALSILRSDSGAGPGTGEYLFQLGRPGLVGPQLANYPLRMADALSEPGAGAVVAVLGDIRQGYQIVDRQGMTVLRDPYTSKPFVKFYTRRRVGGDVVEFEALKRLKVAA